MATVGWIPAKMIRSGVISEPPPMPVMPISTPTPSPKTMISGSMAAASPLAVQAALGLVLPRPAALAAGAGIGARRAPDRLVAAVVQRVVGQVVLRDEPPNIPVAPLGQRIELPQAVGLVPFELGRVCAGRPMLAPQAGHPGVQAAQRPLQSGHLLRRAAVLGRPGLAVRVERVEHLDAHAVTLLDRAPGPARLVEQHAGVDREH